jgi:hypothetical protein
MKLVMEQGLASNKELLDDIKNLQTSYTDTVNSIIKYGASLINDKD